MAAPLSKTIADVTVADGGGARTRRRWQEIAWVDRAISWLVFAVAPLATAAGLVATVARIGRPAILPCLAGLLVFSAATSSRRWHVGAFCLAAGWLLHG